MPDLVDRERLWLRQLPLLIERFLCRREDTVLISALRLALLSCPHIRAGFLERERSRAPKTWIEVRQQLSYLPLVGSL